MSRKAWFLTLWLGTVVSYTVARDDDSSCSVLVCCSHSIRLRLFLRNCHSMEGAQTRPAEREREREKETVSRDVERGESGGLTDWIASCYFDTTLSGLNTENYESLRCLGGSRRVARTHNYTTAALSR